VNVLLVMSALVRAESPARAAPARVLDFATIYSENFDFVWRSVRRLGVPEAAAEDVTQEVFVIVHRRLDSYEGRASVRGWLFGIVRGVVANVRRAMRRNPIRSGHDAVEVQDLKSQHPQDHAERAEAVAILYALLDELDDEKRAIFILAELEQLAAPEIAEALELNLNTTYSRLRAARIQFKEAVARQRAREGWRTR
jgi:RNA polymerase sigma-70 factor, ECF subfamily